MDWDCGKLLVLNWNMGFVIKSMGSGTGDPHKNPLTQGDHYTDDHITSLFNILVVIT